MRYLLDQGLPRSTVQHLRVMDVDSEHVGELGMAAASDAEIIEEAVKRKSVLITLDSDFHALLAKSGAKLPSIVRIRIEGMKGELVARIIQCVDSLAMNDLAEGAPVTVTERRIALRRLPLISNTN